MGYTWILVVIRHDGGVEIDEHESEAEAFAAYERALASDYSDLYLAPARMQAHRIEPGTELDPITDAIGLVHRIAPVPPDGVAIPEELYPLLGQILEERRRQDAQWGGPQHDDEHTRREWTALVAEHVDRSRKVREDREAWRARMVVVAALAISALASYDRGGRSAQ